MNTFNSGIPPICPIWLRDFRFGPLEWVWRSLTYWKKQPFRIRDRAVA